jgi:hypothetical protein
MLQNECFTWVLFQEYVATEHVKLDSVGAALAVLTEVAVDAKQEIP